MDNSNNPQPVEEEEFGHERSEESRRASLPEYLRLSEDQVEAARADNARVLAESNHPFLRQSPQDAQRARAIREEPDWRRTLSLLDFEIAAGDDSIDTAMRRRTAAQTLAENLAAQGRFGEASVVAPLEEQQREYLQLAVAVARPDDEWCGGDCELRFADDPTRLTREDIIAEVFSIPHGRVMPVNRCPFCKMLNVRPASPENLQRRALRARARALTEGQKPDQAAATLRREKLTAADAFK